MNNIKPMGWFKSLFESKSRYSKTGRLSVEHLEVRLTPDAKAVPAFHDFALGISENNCAANSITLIDDIRLQQKSTDYRSSQVYFCSNDSINFSASAFQSVNKFDAVALQAASTKGVVIIDSSLIATIPVEELKGSLVVSIDGNRNVVSQITTALEGLSNVSVLRIISHGEGGVLWFGNQAFDSKVLTASAMQVASWGNSLTADADILLYGCSIASTDAGKAFVEQFASITQADIGASSNLTGKGGDEVLEFQVGQVSNTLIASAIDYASANLTLVQYTVTTNADSGTGSLREAIEAANFTSANDEIVFASSLFTSGASTITLQSFLPTIVTTATAGTLTITGQGASSLTLSGNNGDINRNFNIFNIATGGNLSISGVTVSGAQTSSNGGAFNNAGILNIANSTLSSNRANDGGAINNSGILNIANSTLSSNSATFGGGAIENMGGALLNIANSTLSSNSTELYGGGIDNFGGTLTVINSTLSGNSTTKSGSGGGGLYSSGQITITNTIIANSTGGDFAGPSTVSLGTATKANNLVTQGTYLWATTVTGGQLNLGPLQDNGGPTFTMALGTGSAAIGAGNATISKGAPINGKDQRGVTRSTTAPSIGAFESANNNNSQYTVTTIADSGTGSLREAIEAANLTSANDEIVFASSLFTSGAITTITLQSALPSIAATSSAGALTITGRGASSLVISGDNGVTNRNFNIFSIASGGDLTISGVTISGAKTSDQGGAFNNAGTLTVTNSALSGNSASVGGAINNKGTGTITNSTFSSNSAVSFGGAIENSSGGILTVSNSTLSNNSAASFGGGIDNFGGTLTVINSTLSGNSLTNGSGGGGLYSSGQITITNTIIANSTGGDFAGPSTVSLGTATKANNLVTQGTYSWATTVTSEQLNLGSLQNNGGPTFTMALGTGSAAIGAGNATISNAAPINGNDQRGVTRSTTAPSIGAFESNSAPTLINTVPSLTTISTLTGASEGISYTITHATLAAAADESDADGGNALSFRIEAVNSGTLTKNGVAVVAGATLLSTGESLVYTAANFGSAINAFTVKAFDGLLVSANEVQVIVNVAAVTGFTTSTSGGNITITGYTAAGAAVIIPSTIGGLPVVAIGANAFSGKTALTSITIPSSVASIGDGAFSGCSNLASFNFSGNAPTLAGTNVFNGVAGGTVYYVAGTTGWPATYGGLNTVVVVGAGSPFNTAITITAPAGVFVASSIGEINPALETDFYKYTATATGVVDFAMTAINNSGVNTILTIYNANFIQIAQNDDSNGASNSFISLNVTANAIYFLRATAIGSGTGAYRVSATPAGVSFGTAIALTAPQGSTVASYDAVINPALEADFYTYTATATGVVNFAMTAINNSGVDTFLTIYNSSYVEIAQNDDSNGTLNSFISLPVTAGSVYYIRATAYGSSTGAYRVSAIFIAPTVVTIGAPGDSFMNAITLASNSTGTVASYDGEINPTLEADFYKYIATATGVVNFAMAAINNSGVDTILTIYNSNEVQIAQNDDSNGTLNSFISLNVTANAIYYIRATAFGSSTGAYRVSASSGSVFNSIPLGATFGTAINLTAGDPIEGVISTGLEADYYKYIATATGVVNFAMAAINNSSIDSILTIYNSSYVEIAQNDDSSGTLNSFVSVNVNANAIYYIKATAYGSGTGAYRVSATILASQNAAPGATFATAIPLTRFAPITGAISNSLEADYYIHEATTTGNVNFAMTAISNSGVDTYLTIYNSNFVEIAQNDDSNGTLNSFISLNVTANAIYYIRATAYGLGTGAYQVSATLQTADDVGGNLDATATLLSFTGNVASESKTIGAALDVDVFRFTADVEGVYEIGVAPANASALAPVIEVIGNDGTTLLEFSSANAGVSAFALPFLTLGQQVYVRVSGSGSTGNYTLQVTKPTAVVDFYANNYNTGTNSLPVGILTLSPGANSGSLTNANMVIESATDVDIFSFTTNRSGPIQVSVSKADGSNLDTIVSILDASGNVFEFNDDSNGTTNSTVVFQANNNNLYYIRVSGYGGTIGRFDISVTDLITTAVAETDGAGTDLTHATSLTFVANNASFQGDISSTGDQDFFSITAPSSGVLAISLAAGVSSVLDTYLYLYNSDKVLILEDDDSGSGLNSLISTNVLTGQTYYLQASGFGSSTGAYTISASISAADDHANQAGESATNLTVINNAVSNTSGAINPSTDNDVFLYKATADGSITINVTPTNNDLNSYLFVYDSTGNILLDYNDGNSSTDRTSRISLQVVRDEVYYFMVSGAEGTTGIYNISVTSVTDTVGNTIALATNLPVSTTATPDTTVGTANGSIGSTGDVDFYKVAINTNGRYAFRASANPTSNGLDTTIAVYSENGQLMGENDDASASSLNSSLSLNLTAGEIVYVGVAGFGESTGDFIFDVVYLSAAIADDFGDTIDSASSFSLDAAHAYSFSNAEIQFLGDADVFHGVADISGNITLVLTPSANLQANIRVFVTRSGENIQVGSVNGSAVGGVVNFTFPVAASENFYIEISGNNGTVGTYSLSVANVIATNTARPIDASDIDRIADELRELFTRIIAAANSNADINATSQSIMTEFAAIIQQLIPGFTGLFGFFDPLDGLSISNGTVVGFQGNNSTNSNPSASLSRNGALDLVVIPGAAAGQYNLNMAGTGSGQVLAGVAMIGANGQIIYPTVTGGGSSGGIAASDVPKTGLNLVLDFGSNSGGGGNGGNGGNGGGTVQSGPVSGSTTASTSASSTSASTSTASAATGLTSLAALANAITQSATASGAETGASSLLANLASLALGLGNTTTTLDEKQLAKDLGGDAPAGDLGLSSLNTVKTLSDFVTITFAQAYKGFNQAVFSILDAGEQVVSEIANIFDKVLPALVPSEFENAVENLLVQTKNTLLQDGKANLLKTGDILADIILSKLVENLPPAQPAKNKVDAKVPSFEFVIANFVQQNKNDSAAEENCFGEHTAITEKIPHCFEEIFNSVNRNALDDSLTGPSILRNDQQGKAAEALGVIAGVLLAPGILSSTNGTQAPAFEKPKPRKQNS